MWPFGGGNTADATIKINYKGEDAVNGLKSLKSTIGTIITALALKQIASYTYELGKLGAQSLLVEKNFANFAQRAGKTTEDMMGKLRKATMGTVKDIELQQFAMKALISGIKFDDVITMMDYVTKYAMATGDSVSERMRTVVTGLARGSALMLDDVGIMVTKTGNVVVTATNQMKEKVGQFTTSEQDAAIAAAKMNAEFENQKALVGKAIVPLWAELNKLITKMLPTIGAVTADFANMLNMMLTKTTFGDIRTEKYIELAKAAKKVSIIEDELNRNIEKRGKLIEVIEKRKEEKKESEKYYGKFSWIFSPDAEIKMKMEQLADAQEQIEKLTKAKKEMEAPPPTSLPTSHTKPDEEALKKAKQDKKEFEERMAREEKDRRNKVEEDKFNAVVDWNEKYNNFLAMQNQERIAIEEEGQKAILGEDEYYHKQKIDLLKYQKEVYPELEREINALIKEENEKYRKEDLKKAKEHTDKIIAEKIREAETIISTTETVTNALIQISDARTSKELKNIDELLNKKLISQKEYDNRREKIEKEATEKRRAWARVQQAIAIAEATINVFKAASEVYATEFGDLIIKSFAMAAAIAEGMATVAVIQAQNFATGRIGNSKRGRQADNIIAAVGEGETIIPAQQSTVHEETLRAIANNTANTARGMRTMGNAGVINNFYGISTEQVLNVMTMAERKNRVGQKI